MKMHYIGKDIVSFRDEGSGDPIFFLHSSASNSGQWKGVFAQMRGEYRVIAPDLFGYGDTSAWTQANPMTLRDEVRNIVTLIRSVGRSVHLVGHSYGGAVALHLAKYWPGLLTSLTLIEPAAFNVLAAGDHEERTSLDEVRSLSADVGRAVSEGRSRDAACRFVDYWNGDGHFSKMTMTHQNAIMNTMSKVASDFEALWREPAFLPNNLSINLPSLVIAGTRSPRPARQVSRILAENMINCRHRTITNAGHMSPLTHVDVVVRHLIGHIGSHTSKANLLVA